MVIEADEFKMKVTQRHLGLFSLCFFAVFPTLFYASLKKLVQDVFFREFRRFSDVVLRFPLKKLVQDVFFREFRRFSDVGLNFPLKKWFRTCSSASSTS